MCDREITMRFRTAELERHGLSVQLHRVVDEGGHGLVMRLRIERFSRFFAAATACDDARHRHACARVVAAAIRAAAARL